MSTEDYNRNYRKKGKVTRPSELRNIMKNALKNPAELNSAMAMINEAVAEHLAYLAYDKALEILEREWYGRMEPAYYERTYDLLSALNVTQDYRGHYNVGVDARALTQMSRKDGDMSLGQHMGFNDEAVASEIWAYVNEGNGDSKIPYSGIDIIGKVEDYLNSIADAEVTRFLGEAGFDVN